MHVSTQLRNGHFLLAVSIAAALSACSTTDSTPALKTCRAVSCAQDAGKQAADTQDGSEPPELDASSTPADAGSEFDAWVLLRDAGDPSGGPLVVKLDVSGQERICGQCAVLTANVHGGQIPYHYTWSDPALTGPGPHQVCDEKSRKYSVTVTDTPIAAPDLIAPTPMAQTASANLDCTPSTGDAGAGFAGCQVFFNASIFNSLSSEVPDVSHLYACASLDGGAGIPGKELLTLDAGSQQLFPGEGFLIPGGLRAGESYEFVLEQLFPLTIGGKLAMEFWGSREGCSENPGNGDEKLGTFTMQGIPRQTVCLRPKHDLDKLLLVAANDNTAPIFAISFGVSMTLCKQQCSGDQ